MADKALVLAELFVIILLVGTVSNELGFTTQVVAFSVPESPQDAGILDSVLIPFKWIWNSLGALWQMMTFQADGLPSDLNLVLTTFLAVYFGWTGLRLARG